MPDPAAFIRANLPLREVPGTGLRLHLAGPRSGLSRLVPPGGTPYWAHPWPGGLALALHLAAHPEAVRGRPVLDLGTGSGLAALAAARAGAAEVLAVDTDPLAAVAVRLNADANGVSLRVEALPRGGIEAALRAWAAPAKVLLAGDLFYDAAVAERATRLLDLATSQGAEALVGDIGRRFLPRARLEPLATYPVRDVGDAEDTRAGVFRWS